jgi:hypothetical protein
MEDSNKFTKILYDNNTAGLKKLVCANVAKKNRVHANVCGMLSPHSTCRERFSCNTQQTIKLKKSIYGTIFVLEGPSHEISLYFFLSNSSILFFYMQSVIAISCHKGVSESRYICIVAIYGKQVSESRWKL